MKKTLLLIVYLLLKISITYSQEQGSLINLKWYPHKIIEDNGEVINLESTKKKEYIFFGKNGNFESVEYGKIVKGTWHINQGNDELTIVQNTNLKYPQKSIAKIKSLSNNELVLIVRDANNTPVIVFFFKKP